MTLLVLEVLSNTPQFSNTYIHIEVPEEDLYVFVSLSPGVLREAPGEDLFVIYVACLLVLC